MSQALGQRIEVSSLVETLIARLERAIMTGELPAGARLSEQALAAELGVSRGPLREAMRRLEGRRLISRTHNVGARVSALSSKDLAELLVLREALEGVAARLAAETMSGEEISDLETLLESHRSNRTAEAPVENSASTYYQAPEGGDFHFRIIKGSGNARLMDMLLSDAFYLLRVYRYRSSAVQGRTLQAFAEHRAILAAIAARDGEGAEKAMRYHLRNSHENMLRNIDTVLAQPGPTALEAEAVYADRRSRRRVAS